MPLVPLHRRGLERVFDLVLRKVPLAVGTEVARVRRLSPAVVLARGGAREAADEGARAGDASGARPREGATRLAGARSSVAGRGEDEDGGASGTGWRKLGVFFWVHCWRRKVLDA